MKRFLGIAAFAAVSAVASLPLSASAQTRVQLVVTNQPVRIHDGYDGHFRHAPQYRDRVGYGYAPNAWDARNGRYIDRNRDGMHDRRARRDMDRDGIPDRYDRDLDNDGVRNRYDRDMDGDGVPNYRDRRPDNRRWY